MPHLLLRELPRYECLTEAAEQFPALDPSALEAFLHLLYAADSAFRVSNAHLQSHHISQSRFITLMLLLDHAEEGGTSLTPAELAEMSGITRAGMTGVVDSLEKERLVTRTPSKEDRRMMAVSLTAAGRAMLDEVLPPYFSLVGKLMGRLTESERKTLVLLLEKVVHQANEMGPPNEEHEP